MRWSLAALVLVVVAATEARNIGGGIMDLQSLVDTLGDEGGSGSEQILILLRNLRGPTWETEAITQHYTGLQFAVNQTRPTRSSPTRA